MRLKRHVTTRSELTVYWPLNPTAHIAALFDDTRCNVVSFKASPFANDARLCGASHTAPNVSAGGPLMPFTSEGELVDHEPLTDIVW